MKLETKFNLGDKIYFLQNSTDFTVADGTINGVITVTNEKETKEAYTVDTFPGGQVHLEGVHTTQESAEKAREELLSKNKATTKKMETEAYEEAKRTVQEYEEKYPKK